jgi:hypothetical protein
VSMRECDSIAHRFDPRQRIGQIQDLKGIFVNEKPEWCGKFRRHFYLTNDEHHGYSSHCKPVP